MNIYLDLFLTFARIGGLTFGGGYAMLPILQREVVEKRKWVSHDELMDYYAVGQCTPGIIAINTATFIGNRQKGVPGGISATLGMVFPSLIIITIIAAFISNFAELPLIKNAFAGIRVCVFVLVVQAILKLKKNALIDLWTGIIFAIVFLASVLTSLSPVIFILLAGAAGAVLQSMKGKIHQ